MKCSECGQSPAPYEEDGGNWCTTHYLMRGMTTKAWRRLMAYDLSDQNSEMSLSKGQDTTSQSPPITQDPPS